MKYNQHIGEINTNKYGETFKIIGYNNCNDIIIEFLNDVHYTKHTNYSYFKQGKVASPYAKRTFGVGYLGEGEYTFTDKNNLDSKGHAIKTVCFNYWQSMMYRCYSEKFQKKTAYIDCTVCEEWHNYQNFAKWFYENYYTVNDEIMNLDKDIILKNNKIYSPTTCCFIPAIINKIFVKREKAKNFKVPIGLCQRNFRNKIKYSASIKKYNKDKYLGCFNTIEEAFNVYKAEKEKYIKEVANNYKEYLPKTVYNALYNYQVEITD